jgi:hypothetical protein
MNNTLLYILSLVLLVVMLPPLIFLLGAFALVYLPLWFIIKRKMEKDRDPR